MTNEELIVELRKYGLTNGGSLGRHCGLCDIAADVIEQLTERITTLEQQINN